MSARAVQSQMQPVQHNPKMHTRAAHSQNALGSCCQSHPDSSVGDNTVCRHAVVDAQNALTNSVLERCSSRDKFAALMRQLYDYPKYGTPSRHGDRYIHSYNTGLQASETFTRSEQQRNDARIKYHSCQPNPTVLSPTVHSFGSKCRRRAWCTPSARLTARPLCSSTRTSCQTMARWVLDAVLRLLCAGALHVAAQCMA